ncbi:hypothetical protein VNI00_014779 [Paramarasmius palmivorus]|uniref:Uncharacterized protein n=1 Tax=Paramarasmius palmivorus TaxID=297713 RepID=A0AAW0BQ37_9AGAR
MESKIHNKHNTSIVEARFNPPTSQFSKGHSTDTITLSIARRTYSSLKSSRADVDAAGYL